MSPQFKGTVTESPETTQEYGIEFPTTSDDAAARYAIALEVGALAELMFTPHRSVIRCG